MPIQTVPQILTFYIHSSVCGWDIKHNNSSTFDYINLKIVSASGSHIWLANYANTYNMYNLQSFSSFPSRDCTFGHPYPANWTRSPSKTQRSHWSGWWMDDHMETGWSHFTTANIKVAEKDKRINLGYETTMGGGCGLKLKQNITEVTANSQTWPGNEYLYSSHSQPQFAVYVIIQLRSYLWNRALWQTWCNFSSLLPRWHLLVRDAVTKSSQ